MFQNFVCFESQRAIFGNKKNNERMLSNNSRTKCCSGLFDALPVSTVLFIWFRYKIGVNNKNYLLITSHSKNENPSPPYMYVCHAHKQFQRTNNRLIIYFMKFVIEAFVKTKIAFHSCNETYPYARTCIHRRITFDQIERTAVVRRQRTSI